uniref:Major facilitator superfamily (MFS) profile domain-containing protein n=1 Tax=Acrobeloides nanus TaxID=290746 RepID=A0A914E244_9BILA
MIAFNFTIICMNQNSTDETIPNAPVHKYTQTEKSTLIWAVAVGSIVGTFPFNYFYTQHGGRFVFLIAGLISIVSTALVPLAASLGLWVFSAVRFFQGLAFSANFAGIGVVVSRWAPLSQTGIFLSFLTSFVQLSSIITNPIAGIVCETIGWPYVYYFHAIASACLFFSWFFFYLDRPEQIVSTREIENIHKDKTQAHINMDKFIPYLEICKNPVILTVWLNALAEIGASVFLLTYIPTYFNNVLKFGVAETGFLGVLPPMMNIVFKITSGYASDEFKLKSEKFKMIGFNSFALVPSGLLYLVLGYVKSPWAGFGITVALHSFLGANCGGFYKCGTLVSRQYSHFVIANIQFIKCISLFAAPALVAIFVRDDTSEEQWRHTFFVLGILLLTTNTLFCFMATDQPAEFTKITRQSKEEKKENKEQDKLLESGEAGSDAKWARLKTEKHPEVEESLSNTTQLLRR